jgi:protein TonB
MAAPAPLPTRSEPPAPEGDQIFTSLVVSNPTRKRGLGALPVSLSVHLAVVAAIVLIPLYWSSSLPEVDPFHAFFYDPPAAMAAPLPKGRSLVETQTRPKPVTPDPTPRKTPVLQEPVEVQEKPLQPESKAPDTEQSGSETGSENGIPEGMEGGQEGGVAGGVLDGTIGGCVGCSGNGPVVNPDEAPHLLKQVKPVYPQDAFVKKVEGTVLIEAIVDATGHVVRPRVVRSIPVLDAAAIVAVQQWLFAPARHHGIAVASYIRAPIAFRIF